MIVTALIVLFGIPTIAALAWAARQRARSLSQRITQVQEEMARDPRPPMAALADLMQEQDMQDRRK